MPSGLLLFLTSSSPRPGVSARDMAASAKRVRLRVGGTRERVPGERAKQSQSPRGRQPRMRNEANSRRRHSEHQVLARKSSYEKSSLKRGFVTNKANSPNGKLWAGVVQSFLQRLGLGRCRPVEAPGPQGRRCMRGAESERRTSVRNKANSLGGGSGAEATDGAKRSQFSRRRCWDRRPRSGSQAKDAKQSQFPPGRHEQ